jgi:hypothetical protein
MQMIAGQDVLQVLAFVFRGRAAQDGQVKAAVKPGLKRCGAAAVQATDENDAFGLPWGGGPFDLGQKAIGLGGRDGNDAGRSEQPGQDILPPPSCG